VLLATLKLLEEGNTIPFIARYRKEATGNLDEEVIRSISEIYMYQVSLLKRKEDVIRLIEEKELMTEELRNAILVCTKLVEVEDLYRPFKEKKKTKATEAIKNGLEPLAKYILGFNNDVSNEALKYITEEVKTKEDAIQGASYIIAEMISDNADYRKWIRNYFFNNGMINSKIKKGVEDLEKVYEMYYEYQYSVKAEKPHRILAINRGENESILNVSITVDDEYIN
jgi:protein Tex